MKRDGGKSARKEQEERVKALLVVDEEPGGVVGPVAYVRVVPTATYAPPSLVCEVCHETVREPGVEIRDEKTGRVRYGHGACYGIHVAKGRLRGVAVEWAMIEVPV